MCSIDSCESQNESKSSSDSWMGRYQRKNIFSVALINVRSLKAKLRSFKNSLDELGADVCLITETWFKENDNQINQILEDFKHQYNYHFLRRDRPGSRRGGGVAICFNAGRISFVKAKIPPSKHEVFAAVGRRVGQRRKIVVIEVYVPPHYNAEQNRSISAYTNDV